MSFKPYALARQFFDSVLQAKGIDQPTIDFVWENGESLYLWQQSFGSLTKAQLQQLAEVAAEANVSLKNLPPRQMVDDCRGFFRFDSFTFYRGHVEFFYEGKLVYALRPGNVNYLGTWDSGMVTSVNGLDGKMLFHTTPT